MADVGVRRCRPLLGTFVEITAPLDCAAVIDRAFDAIARVHACMSYHERDSDLTALRRSPAGQIVTVNPWTVTVLRQAKRLYDRSGGLFDVAIGGDLAVLGYLPVDDAVGGAPLTGTTADIEIVDDSHVRCRRAMLIDLGGIAKGFAVDCAIDALSAAGVERGSVNAGGDLRVIGDEIVALRGLDNTIEGAIEVTDAALASSSSRWRGRHFRAGNMAPHLGIDRKPLREERTVTVIAPDCMIADAMTKIALADHGLAEAMLVEFGGAIVSRPTLDLAA